MAASKMIIRGILYFSSSRAMLRPVPSGRPSVSTTLKWMPCIRMMRWQLGEQTASAEEAALDLKFMKLAHNVDDMGCCHKMTSACGDSVQACMMLIALMGIQGSVPGSVPGAHMAAASIVMRSGGYI